MRSLRFILDEIVNRADIARISNREEMYATALEDIHDAIASVMPVEERPERAEEPQRGRGPNGAMPNGGMMKFIPITTTAMPTYTDKEIREQNRFEIALLVAITIGFIAFMTSWNVFVQPRLERRAYEAGQAEAERRAAAAGGWEKWIEREITTTTNKEK